MQAARGAGIFSGGGRRLFSGPDFFDRCDAGDDERSGGRAAGDGIVEQEAVLPGIWRGGSIAGLCEGSTGVFWSLIRNYYRHGFRELFMEGQGPLQVHKAVISTLAGQVFPRPAWKLRWRLWFYRLCVALQQYWPLVPRRAEFSLVNERPVEVGMREPAGEPLGAA